MAYLRSINEKVFLSFIHFASFTGEHCYSPVAALPTCFPPHSRLILAHFSHPSHRHCPQARCFRGWAVCTSAPSVTRRCWRRWLPRPPSSRQAALCCAALHYGCCVARCQSPTSCPPSCITQLSHTPPHPTPPPSPQNPDFYGVNLTPLLAPATAGYFGQARPGMGWLGPGVRAVRLWSSLPAALRFSHASVLATSFLPAAPCASRWWLTGSRPTPSSLTGFFPALPSFLLSYCRWLWTRSRPTSSSPTVPPPPLTSWLSRRRSCTKS